MKREVAEKVLSNCLGSILHEQWRKTRFHDGIYEPRLITTKDQKWIDEHGTDQVDIANTSFDQLPSDWQKENLIAGEVAVKLALEPGMTTEEMASGVHDAWLERNGEWAPAEQKLPYEQLSEEEKAKDREQILMAFDLMDKVRNGEIDLEAEAKKYHIVSEITLSSIEKNIEQNQEIQ